MKTRESWLQNGIFIYKTGLSPCYLPCIKRRQTGILYYKAYVYENACILLFDVV